MLAAWIFLPKILASSIISAARAHSSAGQSARFTSVRSLVRVQLRPLPQSTALLTGERDKNTPFSTHSREYVLPDMPVERFFSSLRFEHRSKLDELGTEIGNSNSIA